MCGQVDVGVASTSDTLERAKTVGFSIPYFAFEMVVTANEKSGIKSLDDMKGKTVGATAGTFEAICAGGQVKEWGGGEFRPYQTQADVFLALSQGQLDATVSTSTVAQANVKSGNFPGINIVGKAPVRHRLCGALHATRGVRPHQLPEPLHQPAGPHRPLRRALQEVGRRRAADLTMPNVYR